MITLYITKLDRHINKTGTVDATLKATTRTHTGTLAQTVTALTTNDKIYGAIIASSFASIEKHWGGPVYTTLEHKETEE